MKANAANTLMRLCLWMVMLGLVLPGTALGDSPPSLSFDFGNQDPPFTSEDQSKSLPFVISDDQTPAGELSLSKSSDNPALLPEENIVIQREAGGNGNLVMTPMGGESGEVAVAITVSDGSNQTRESFVLTVRPINDPPALDLPAPQLTDEEESLSFNQINENLIAVDDPDAGDNPLRMTLTVEHGSLTTAQNHNAQVNGNGTAQVEILGSITHLNAALRGLEYTPEANWNGNEALEIEVNDQGHSGYPPTPFSGSELTDSQTLVITVNAINDRPVLSLPGDQTLDEDGELVFSPDHETAIQVADSDAGENPVSLSLTVDMGELSVSEATGVEVAGNESDELVLTGPVEALNRLLDGLIYQPAPEENGTVTLTGLLDDQGHTGTGGALTDEKSLVITVNPVNDGPTLSLPGNQTGNEDSPIRFSQLNRNRIQMSDKDAGENPVQIVLEVSAGSLAVEAEYADQVDGNETDRLVCTQPLETINAALAQLSYTPKPDDNGEVRLNVTADDRGHTGAGGALTDTGEIILSLNPINDAPVLNTQGDMKLTAIDQDPEENPGNTVTEIIKSAGGNRITDPDGAGSMEGMAVFEADTANGVWEYSLNEGQTWIAFGTLSQTNATLLNETARIRFVPEAGWSGQSQIRFRAWDGSDGKESGASGVDLSQTGQTTPYSAESETATIQVIPPEGENSPPEADAGADQSVTENNPVTLDGSGSGDPDSDIAVYQWEQISGTGVSLENDDSVQAGFTAPDVGQNGATLVFELLVIDSVGHQDRDQVEVAVNWDGEAGPAADAGADQTVTEGETVFLNGTGSQDAGGNLTGYSWTQQSGPSVDLSDLDTMETNFIAPQVEADGAELVFELTVENGAGQTDSDTCTVWVNDSQQPSNDPPQADAGANQTVTSGDTVRLDGTGSTDPDDGIAGYQWSQTGDPLVNLSAATDPRPTFTAPTVASQTVLSFSLTVTDRAGQSDTDSAQVTVNPAPTTNQPPVAMAGPNQTVNTGDTVILDGSDSHDPEGQALSYQWTVLSGGELSLDATMNPQFTAPSGGESGLVLEIQLTVTDTLGLSDTDTVTITVRPDPTTQGPVAVAGPDQSAVEGQTVYLDGTGSTGTGLEYAWTQTLGTTAVLSDAGSPTPTLVTPLVGPEGETLQYTLQVTDSAGQTDTDTVTITVTDSGINAYPEGVIPVPTVTDKVVGLEREDGGGGVTPPYLVILENVSQYAIAEPTHRPTDMPYGLFKLVWLTAEPGDTLRFTLHLPEPAPAEYTWYGYTFDLGWHEYGMVEFSEDRTRVTVTVTDGGTGDEDGIADRYIWHYSGLGASPAQPPDSSRGGDDGDEGDSCFIRSLR